MRVLVSLLYPSYFATKVSCTCSSPYLILVWALLQYPSWTIFYVSTICLILDSRTSWRNNNGGIAKLQITSKMSTTALEKVPLVIGTKPRATKLGVKVQECPLTSVYWWPFILLNLPWSCMHNWLTWAGVVCRRIQSKSTTCSTHDPYQAIKSEKSLLFYHWNIWTAVATRSDIYTWDLVIFADVNKVS